MFGLFRTKKVHFKAKIDFFLNFMLINLLVQTLQDKKIGFTSFPFGPKNLQLDKSNLPQNSNFGREFVQKSVVQIPALEGQKILFFFLFIFKFFTQKWISFI